MLGVLVTDDDGRQANAFYDVVLPRPCMESSFSCKFSGAGLNFDWYQPIHENGNILSYPEATEPRFAADIGTYDIPCPKNDKKCNSDGTKTISGAMIPAEEKFIDAVKGSIALNYDNKFESGDTFKYQHKLQTSTDVKVGFEVETLTVKDSMSAKVGFTEGGSWGSLQTDKNSTTKETGITITRGKAISPSQAYAFYPIYYSAKDGTIKVAHASDPLGSNSGKAFWNRLYGHKADPALNLPLRFALMVNSSGDDVWVPNTEASRKQMRGFFVLSKDPDPVTGQYVILSQAPVAGDRVRLSAQVYDYSTAVSFKDCLVSFSAVKYDALNDIERGPRIPIGSTHVSLGPRGTTTAQVIWDTSKFGPAAGTSQDYLIYVNLNSDHAIDEIYPPEDPETQYSPSLKAGINPGQNDEGFGEAKVLAKLPTFTAQSQPPVHLYLGSQALEVKGPTGLSTKDLLEPVGYPVRMRAEVCASGYTRNIADLVVFDGPPANGETIAWKRVPATDARRCDPVWFDWTPRAAVNHTLEAVVLQDDDDPSPGNNSASIDVKAY